MREPLLDSSPRPSSQSTSSRKQISGVLRLVTVWLVSSRFSSLSPLEGIERSGYRLLPHIDRASAGPPSAPGWSTAITYCAHWRLGNRSLGSTAWALAIGRAPAILMSTPGAARRTRATRRRSARRSEEDLLARQGGLERPTIPVIVLRSRCSPTAMSSEPIHRRPAELSRHCRTRRLSRPKVNVVVPRHVCRIPMLPTPSGAPDGAGPDCLRISSSTQDRSARRLTRRQ